MTLLEVLVALAIASIVFSAVFLIYRTTAATAIRQREHDRTAFAPAETFAALQQDIGGLVPGGLDDDCGLNLKTTAAKDGAKLSEISFCTWRADTAHSDGMWADAEKITWRIENAGRPNDARLTRTSTGLTGPRSAATVTNEFLRGIAEFRLRLHDGTQWRDDWPPEDSAESTNARPRTLRMELALHETGGTKNWSTDFIVPIGLTATSRIQRISAPAAPPR